MAIQREQVVQTAEKYVSRGKIEPAIREYRKLLADNPNDINTLNRIGDLYARIQRIDEGHVETEVPQSPARALMGRLERGLGGQALS